MLFLLAIVSVCIPSHWIDPSCGRSVAMPGWVSFDDARLDFLMVVDRSFDLEQSGVDWCLHWLLLLLLL